jgi:hypothetical protein
LKTTKKSCFENYAAEMISALANKKKNGTVIARQFVRG